MREATISARQRGERGVSGRAVRRVREVGFFWGVLGWTLLTGCLGCFKEVSGLRGSERTK